MGRYKHDAPKKVNADYSRTKDDFYRMDLDRLDEVHPINRRHMRKAYFAYLQNTPGSKKAIDQRMCERPERRARAGSSLRGGRVQRETVLASIYSLCL